MNTLTNFIINLVLSVPGLLLALTVHEFAHGWIADKMGDPTARYNGRLSLNPVAHMDLFGTICLLFFHFGWAKPVPINPRNFRNKRLGIVAVSLAGPVSNFLLALVMGFVFGAVARFVPLGMLKEFLIEVLRYAIVMNVGLMIFNLIPIPPLDGSKILMEFLPPKYKFKLYSIERYFSIILLVLVYTGILTPVLSFFSSKILMFIDKIVWLVF
ncbi:MAG: site-2 protease family protein [Clostridia bacterium]|nr:site-2 protease family protein [Clostridia bacterium]